MADASIIDIGGVQWNVKDKEARDKITVIEDLVTTKSLPNINIIRKPGYNWGHLSLYNHYGVGKIHFVYIHMQNVSGSGIGTSTPVIIGSINIKPIKETTFMLYENKKGLAMRCYLTPDGSFGIGESLGVSQGNNEIYGELIFAEA